VAHLGDGGPLGTGIVTGTPGVPEDTEFDVGSPETSAGVQTENVADGSPPRPPYDTLTTSLAAPLQGGDFGGAVDILDASIEDGLNKRRAAS